MNELKLNDIKVTRDRFTELRSVLANYEYAFLNVSNMPRLPDSREFSHHSTRYIVDETKSVQWNREQVKIMNQKYDDEYERLKQERINAYNDILEEIASVVAKTINHHYKYEDGSFIEIPMNEIKLSVKFAMEYHYCNYNKIGELIDLLNFWVDCNEMNHIVISHTEQ